MASPVHLLCDQYIQRLCALDPVQATYWGIAGDFPAGTDYGPAGNDARADLARDTLRRLGQLTAAAPADHLAAEHLAATHLRERLEAELAWHDTGEPLRWLQAPFGLPQLLRTCVELMPRGSEPQWQAVADRVAAVPRMLASWRESLAAGASRGLLAGRRQAVEAAAQLQRYADQAALRSLVEEYGAGPAGEPLARAAAAAHARFAETAAWLREEYAPVAAEADGVGPERYAVASRLALGENIDPYAAYEWAWDELRRLEAELSGEVARLGMGATLADTIAALDATEVMAGADAYRGWLQERHDEAIDALHGVHFDIPEPLRSIDVATLTATSVGSAYYTAPTEDGQRPGRTWWPIAGRERFAVWAELTTVYHEGVPGHHLQVGQTRVAGKALSRFSRLNGVSGHSEGWALYAERLADELGWHAREDVAGTRLGMLKASAMRAARVVIDIGLHLDLPLPEPEAAQHGPRWSFETAVEVLRDRGRIAAHRLHPEVVRYCGWPGQAISYKLGERAWLAARDEARTRLGPRFDLKRWHTRALSLGPVGLATLTEALRQA